MKRFICTILCLMVLLSGCSNNKNVPNINKYEADKKMVSYLLDTTVYKDAIEDLIYYSGWSKTDVQLVLDKYDAILTDRFKTDYMAMASDDYVDDAEGTTDIGEMTEEEFEGEVMTPIDGEYDSNAEDDLEDQQDNYDDTESDEYDGHGDMDDPVLNLSYLDILQKYIAYAFEDNLDTTDVGIEEDTDSDNLDDINNAWWYNEDDTEDEMDESKVFEVTSMDAYPNYIVANVSYLYGTNMKVLVSIVDNKIDGYRIYR